MRARGMLSQKDGRVSSRRPPSWCRRSCWWARPPAVPAVGHYMAAKIPGAEKVILERVGHAANIDQPEAFNAAVRAFLERVNL